jgi:hypothetical protein
VKLYLMLGDRNESEFGNSGVVTHRLNVWIWLENKNIGVLKCECEIDSIFPISSSIAYTKVVYFYLHLTLRNWLQWRTNPLLPLL